jgi:hypothetical protein
MKKLYKTYKEAQREADRINAQPTLWDILGACIFGAILGAFIAFNF